MKLIDLKKFLKTLEWDEVRQASADLKRLTPYRNVSQEFDNGHQIYLPVSEDFPDYAEHIEKVLKLLSDIYDTSPSTIKYAIEMAGDNITRSELIARLKMRVMLLGKETVTLGKYYALVYLLPDSEPIPRVQYFILVVFGDQRFYGGQLMNIHREVFELLGRSVYSVRFEKALDEAKNEIEYIARQQIYSKVEKYYENPEYVKRREIEPLNLLQLGTILRAYPGFERYIRKFAEDPELTRLLDQILQSLK